MSNALYKYIKDPVLIFLALNNHGLLPWVSDEKIDAIKYRRKMGCKLNLDPPKTFNEKIQWLKIHDHNPEYNELVDKIEAKKKVGALIGEEHIVPMLGQWNDARDIDFDSLPPKFVLKCNHDQGSVVLIHDKDQMDKKNTVKFLNKKKKLNNYWNTREFPYKNIRPQIFAEKFLGGDIRDYKFYCFNGVPKFLYVGQGLTKDHSLKIDYYDLNWNLMPFYRTDYDRLGSVEKPSHFYQMIQIAELLSKNVPFVRIDLFEENENVYFSEFTLYPASGCMPFEPVKYDSIVGEWLDLSNLI